jgi:hypothetical protein
MFRLEGHRNASNRDTAKLLPRLLLLPPYDTHYMEKWLKAEQLSSHAMLGHSCSIMIYNQVLKTMSSRDFAMSQHGSGTVLIPV